MVFKWLRQSRKTVIFNPNGLDQTLLAAVKAELERQPGRSFSNLCKEALHQFLLDGQGHSNASRQPLEERVADLQAQLLSLEQRFFAKEKHRLEQLEAQLQLLTVQVAQLGTHPPSSPPLPAASVAPVTPTEPEEAVIEDPLLARLSGLIDDF